MECRIHFENGGGGGHNRVERAGRKRRRVRKGQEAHRNRGRCQPADIRQKVHGSRRKVSTGVGGGGGGGGRIDQREK